MSSTGDTVSKPKLKGMVAKWNPRHIPPAQTANRTMLRQFYCNLEVLFDLCEEPQTDAEKRTFKRLEDILEGRDQERNGKQSWQNAYAAEQLLMTIVPEHFVRAELPKRYAEVCKLDPNGRLIYETSINRLQDNWDLNTARALLIRILNDTQWSYSQNFQIRKMTTGYYLRLIYLFALTSVSFFLALAFLPWFLNSLESSSLGSQWGFGGFIVMLAAGFVGSSFSMLIRQQQVVTVRSIETMALLSGLPMILLRLMVGAGAAAILYFFFEADLISGTVFPNLEEIGFSNTKGSGADHWKTVPNSHLSLLMVWGFLAGFSEKLVPTMLARIDKNAIKNDTPPPNS